ncbi:P-loop containing nucleoside triphosphate hydrolase protein [Poronia punctata]|nr:P-loop containing nucleoside triphosphate hydrolase protein [Poronia punctata]
MPRSDDFELVPQDKEGDVVEMMKSQVKEYEARFNHEGTRSVKEIVYKQDDQEDGDDTDEVAMKYYKYYTKEGKIEKVNLEIRSPHICDALRNVIETYPGQSFTGNVTLTGKKKHATLACLFHHRKELKRYRDQLSDQTAERHVSLVIHLFERELRKKINRFETNIRNETMPCVAFKDLWMLFKPGDYVFGGEKHSKFINRLEKIQYEAQSTLPPFWSISTNALTHNGNAYGYISRGSVLGLFEGVMAVSALPIHPIQYHPNRYAVQKYMVYRGKKYCALNGVSYKAYKGTAVVVDKVRTVAINGRASYTYPTEDVQIDGRVMLDTEAFTDERNTKDIKLSVTKGGETSDLTDEDLMICHYAKPGFSLSEKRWCWFFVDLVDDITFDDGAFEALLLPAKQKRLIRALTTQHTTATRGSFDDLIKGKGQGCIFLLHGEPGIGKTFTAEGIADDIRRPLYVMMSGELGSDVKTVDQRLRKVLKLATKWNAVLLIDEADVFLEKRSSHDLARNSLVSIFLRTLEYYSGVLFLTTNRINSFDLAFQSRIHLALKYHGLDAHSREKLWKLFLKRTSNFNEDEWPAEVLQELAAADINGRQIKNTVRTAHTLALAEKEKLGVGHIRDVLDTVREFQEDFNKTTQAAENLTLASEPVNELDDGGEQVQD